ncbi:MAG: EAL domain-containing protein [Halioglobus sp.]|nr:EAL domain-containing protein [Halioglobus sp.]
MTVAAKINAYTTVVVIVACLLLGVLSVRSEYGYRKEQLVEQTYSRIRSKPQLPVAIYTGDRQQQEAILQQLLRAAEAIRFVAVIDAGGKVVSRADRNGFDQYEALPLPILRGDTPTTESSLVWRDTDVVPTGHDILAGLSGGERLWDLTVPVLSVVNPQEERLTARDFAVAQARQGRPGSLHVMAYVHVGISRTLVWASLLPRIALICAGVLGLTAVGWVVNRAATRRITAPFSNLVRMAQDIATGRPVQSRGLENNTEFKELVTLLNSIVGQFKSRTTQMEVDQQLLSMKVMERTTQLSKRNEELNQAVQEITETKDRLHKLAYYDSLTSLPNRRLFTEQLDLLLRLGRRRSEMVGLLFLDLDNFKRINDSLGHSAGDLLLRETAKRLARCIRDSDVLSHFIDPNSTIDVSRLGGDEFTVVLNQLKSPQSATIVAQRLLDVLRQPLIIEGQEIVVTPSIGIAIAPNDADTVEGLLKAADTAMYNAKADGKNVYRLYSPDMVAADVERLQLENDLRKAIDRGELSLHYQPQVDTLTGSVVGAEALMRWEHPDKGAISPFHFIPLAEEIGLIGVLGEWALETACRQMVELQTQGVNLPKVSVNVSALQFNGSFSMRVAEILRQTGLRPSRLELELTEGIMMEGDSATIDAIARLKELGVQLSIDDFGTGYSSLSYLSRFPLDELKIDRCFVVGMERNENDANLVIAIIAMAKSMKLRLVAEGVENLEQYRFLRQHGTNVIQGYMFSKPVPLEDLKPMLRQGYFREQIEGPGG